MSLVETRNLAEPSRAEPIANSQANHHLLRQPEAGGRLIWSPAELIACRSTRESAERSSSIIHDSSCSKTTLALRAFAVALGGCASPCPGYPFILSPSLDFASLSVWLRYAMNWQLCGQHASLDAVLLLICCSWSLDL